MPTGVYKRTAECNAINSAAQNRSEVKAIKSAAMKGIFEPREIRICLAPGCNNTFECKVTSDKKYCCSGHARIGKPSPLRGRTKDTDLGMAAASKKLKGRKQSKERIENRVKTYRRKTYEEICGIEKAKELKKIRSLAAIKQQLNTKPDTNEKIRKTLIKRWLNPEFAAEQIKARNVKPNKCEKFLDRLFQKLFPNEYKYVGDGKFWVEGKNPDFININGQKKIVEHFGDYYHGEERTGISKEQHVKERINIFAKYGYQTLVIWECELEDLEKLVKKLLDFHNVGLY